MRDNTVLSAVHKLNQPCLSLLPSCTALPYRPVLIFCPTKGRRLSLLGWLVTCWWFVWPKMVTHPNNRSYMRYIISGTGTGNYIQKNQKQVKITTSIIVFYRTRSIQCNNQSWNCTSLKSGFYFQFHSPSNTKSALPNFICT